MSMLKAFAACLAVAAMLAPLPAAGGTTAGPSRPAINGCAWEKLADATLGLAAWVQRCDFGFRKIDFVVTANALAIRYSDGGAPDPLVDVIDLLPGETPDAGVKRVFAARTAPALAARCVLAPYRGGKLPPGAKRYTFIPDAAYRKALKARENPNEVGDPPCGEWGEAPDGIQYFETWPGSRARRVLFVRAGQDEPLFDEQTLRLIEPVANPSLK